MNHSPMPVPVLLNELWSPNFVSDRLVSSRWFHVLAIHDVCVWRCLAAVADFSLSGKRVARKLDRLMIHHGKSKAISSDNARS